LSRLNCQLLDPFQRFPEKRVSASQAIGDGLRHVIVARCSADYSDSPPEALMNQFCQIDEADTVSVVAALILLAGRYMELAPLRRLSILPFTGSSEQHVRLFQQDGCRRKIPDSLRRHLALGLMEGCIL